MLMALRAKSVKSIKDGGQRGTNDSAGQIHDML